MKCATHAEVDAIATCCNCGRAICPECTQTIAKRMYCADCAERYDEINVGATPQQIVINQSASSSASAAAAAPAVPMGYQLKNPGMAALLSFLIVGAGQVYNGQVGKGILMFILCVGLWFVFLGWIVNIWSIFDAYSQAKLINARGY